MALLTSPIDGVETEPFGNNISTRETGKGPAPRTALIRRIRQEIRLGLYETDDKIDAVVDRLYEDL